MEQQHKDILFYKKDGAYGEFSNFYASPIEIEGKVFPTTEHYFQAQKFAGTKHEEEIRLIDTPYKAAQLGRNRNYPLRKDWEEVKIDVM